MLNHLMVRSTGAGDGWPFTVMLPVRLSSPLIMQ